MEAKGALRLLPEEEPLLLRLPHEWALVPRTVEDSGILSTPELGGTGFLLASLPSTTELFSNPHSSCWKWGCWTWWFSSPSSTFHQELDS